MDKPARLQVFVYGTLMPGGRYHDEFCGPFHFCATPAKIKARLHHLPDLRYPACTEPAASWVKGFLMEFADDPQRVLSHLDYLEGIDPDTDPSNHEYYRIQQPVFAENTETQLASAWVYFMSQEKVNSLHGQHIPSGSWNFAAYP